MLPNQVLPAIPRQKVHHEIHEEIGEVMYVYEGDIVVFVDGHIEFWNLLHCEPIPEEPRQLHIGDAVFVRGTVISGEDADNYGIYSRISGISKDGECKIVDRLDWVKKHDIRHATPEELAKYF